MKYLKIADKVHADHIKVALVFPHPLFDPEEVLLRHGFADHELDTFHVLQPLLIVLGGILLPYLLVIRLCLVELTLIEDIHDGVLVVELEHVVPLSLSQLVVFEARVALVDVVLGGDSAPAFYGAAQWPHISS